MSPVEWYYAHGDEKAGPVASTELKELASAGELTPEDLVWREGMEQWVAARQVKGLFEATDPKAPDPPSQAEDPFVEGVQPVSPIPTTAPGVLPEPGPTALDRPRRHATRYPFDAVLDALRAQFTAESVESTSKIFAACGHYCLYAAMLAGLGVSVALSVRAGVVDPVLRGVVWLLILAVLQYVAGRLCAGLERLNRTTAVRVSGTAFLDSFALLSAVSGLVMLLGAAVLAVRSEAYWLILAGLVAFVTCEYLAFIALSPATLHVSVVSEARAADEAIGVLSFLLKAMLRLAPVAFGAGVVCGTLWLLYACYLALAPPGGHAEVAALLGTERLAGLEATVDPALAEKMLEVWPAEVTAATATGWIAAFAALPLVTYVLFLVGYLLVDVTCALLSLPGRLDVLAGIEEEEDE